MKLELQYLLGDGPSCEVSREDAGWCFRQTDWCLCDPDIRILDAAVPLLCDWLRRALGYQEYRPRDRNGLLSGEPPITLIPRFRWCRRNQRPIRLVIEKVVAEECWTAAVTPRSPGRPVRFDLDEARYLLGVIESSVLWGGFAERWGQIPPFTTKGIEQFKAVECVECLRLEER